MDDGADAVGLGLLAEVGVFEESGEDGALFGG